MYMYMHVCLPIISDKASNKKEVQYHNNTVVNRIQRMEKK